MRSAWWRAWIFFFLLAGCTGAPVTEPGDQPRHEPANPSDAPAQTTTGTSAPRPAPSGSPPGPKPVEPAPNATANETAPEPWSLATHGWADLESALVRPGSRIQNVRGGGCTANFLFTNPEGTKAYIGTAAHCFSLGNNEAEVDTVDCSDTYDPMTPENTAALMPLFDPTGSDPLSTPTPTPTVVGAFVYSSFLAMEAADEQELANCAYNDFALIELDANATLLANPAMWHWGGPTEMRDGTVGVGEHVFTFGGTALRNYPSGATRPRDGYVLPSIAGGLTFAATFAGGCIGGDSGSPATDAEGRAFGVMTRALGSGASAYCVGAHLQPMLDYMVAHGGPEVVLATAEVLP